MDIYNFVKDWGGHILSILGIIGGMILYFKHDRKLKKQEEFLNNMQIKQLKRQEEDEKKAIMQCAIIDKTKHERVLRISNIGKADAKNVHVKMFDYDNHNDKSNFIQGYYPLISANEGNIEERILVFMGTPDNIILQITWDDNFSNGRTTNCTLSLY